MLYIHNVEMRRVGHQIICVEGLESLAHVETLKWLLRELYAGDFHP